MKLLLTLALCALALAAQTPEAPKVTVEQATIAAQAAELQVLRIQVQFYVARDQWQAAEKALEAAKLEAAKKPEKPTEKEK